MPAFAVSGRQRVLDGPRLSDMGFLDRMKDKGEELQRKAAPKLDELQKKAGPKLDELREKAGPRVDELREKAGPLAEKAKDRAGKMANTAKESAQGLREGLRGDEDKPGTVTDATPPPPGPKQD